MTFEFFKIEIPLSLRGEQTMLMFQKYLLLQTLCLTMVKCFKLKPLHVFHNIPRTIFVWSLLFLSEAAAVVGVLSQYRTPSICKGERGCSFPILEERKGVRFQYFPNIQHFENISPQIFLNSKNQCLIVRPEDYAPRKIYRVSKINPKIDLMNNT